MGSERARHDLATEQPASLVVGSALQGSEMSKTQPISGWPGLAQRQAVNTSLLNSSYHVDP